MHSICAFANDIDNWGGGYIIIGIEEEDGMPKLPVKGLSKSSIDRINKELLQKCNLIEPRYIPIVEQASYEGKEIIVLWIPGGADRPYKCPTTFPTEKAVKSEKVYYIRKMSNSIWANQLEEKELFMLANNQPYDDRPNPAAKTEDLKSSLILEAVAAPKKKQRRSLEELKELVVVTLTERGNLSSAELASELGYTKVTSTLSKALKELMAEETIQYLEQEKVRSRNQKVCLKKEHNHE